MFKLFLNLPWTTSNSTFSPPFKYRLKRGFRPGRTTADWWTDCVFNQYKSINNDLPKTSGSSSARSIKPYPCGILNHLIVPLMPRVTTRIFGRPPAATTAGVVSLTGVFSLNKNNRSGVDLVGRGFWSSHRFEKN